MQGVKDILGIFHDIILGDYGKIVRNWGNFKVNGGFEKDSAGHNKNYGA